MSDESTQHALAHPSSIRYHLPGLGLLAVTAIGVMRRFVFTNGTPAGTDMLGFISRSSQYSTFGRLFDAWSAESFGSRRVYNFDNILGAITLVIRSPIVTVKILDLLTLFGAGLAAYSLAWTWFRRRCVAAVAGLLYMSSQASLTQWGSGHLNVEIIIALAPLMFLTWSLCLDNFTLRRAIAFTFAVGIDFLIRADLALYVAPFLLLYTAAAVSKRSRIKAASVNAAWTLAVAIPGMLLINSAWLVPSLANYRVKYETLNQVFNTGMLSIRSVDFYPSLLGFGREIGYFAFTGSESWFSYPWLPLWAYYAFATIIPILAYSVLWWRRDRLTVLLVVASLFATLAAPGTRAPIGRVYLWAAQNIPVFGNLRDPTRWLVIQALAYALLSGLTIDYVTSMVTTRLWPHLSIRVSRWLHASAPRGALAVLMVAIGLVPVLPTFVVGLRTWHITQPQLKLLDQIRNSPDKGMEASIPFDQDYQYLIQGSYQGYEHDLGYESALYTGHQDVGDGSWDQRSANFVAYEMSLLDRGDPAFSAMLASAGVSHIISFNYPLVVPQINSLGVGPYSQQSMAKKLSNLTPLLSNSAGTDYTLNNFAPQLSFRRDIAVVLGGNQGTAALADQPGFNLSDWAVLTADDIIETRGYSALLALMRQANLVLLSDERPIDIAVEGTTPLAEFGGITSNSQIDRVETNIPTDQSGDIGSLTDVGVPIPQPQSISNGSSFTAKTSRHIEIWARVLAAPNSATIQARVDGKLVGSITPVTLGTGGLEWLRVAASQVGPGTHQITISAVPSTYGDSYEVDDTRVLDPAALNVASSMLEQTLRDQANRIAYAFDLNDVAKWAWASMQRLAGPDPNYVAFPKGNAWIAPKGSFTTVTATRAPNGGVAPQFSARAGRSLYTVVKINYSKPRNWRGRPYIYLDFKGNNSGNVYQVTFSFGRGVENEARYTFTDNSDGWQTLAFSTANPDQGSGTTDWSRVESVRVALPAKSLASTFAVSVPLPSKIVTQLDVPLPVLSSAKNFKTAASKPSCTNGSRIMAPTWSTVSNKLVLAVSSLNPSCRIYANSRAGYRQLPATTVELRNTGTEKWSYSLTTNRSGILVWTKAYDPLWKLSDRGADGTSLPVQSLLNGYQIGSGTHTGTIAFTGEKSAITGVLITVCAIVLLLLVATFCRRRGRHIQTVAIYGYVAPKSAPRLLRRSSDFCVMAGMVLLASCPVASLTQRDEMLLPLSFGALIAFAASAVFITIAGHTPNAAAGNSHRRMKRSHVVLPETDQGDDYSDEADTYYGHEYSGDPSIR